jgi:hypothetical protein
MPAAFFLRYNFAPESYSRIFYECPGINLFNNPVLLCYASIFMLAIWKI